MRTNRISIAAACCLVSLGAAFGLPSEATSLSAVQQHAGSAGERHQGAKKAKAKQPGDAPGSSNAQSANKSDPFTNNHYVLTGSFPVNGFHKGAPTVVIVDKGSHATYVLQLQGNKIYRVYTASNDIGDADTPTPPGRYTIDHKQMFPEWIPPKTIKHAPVAPYNQTHKNPLGVAAIYLNKFDIDLHGTNQPGLIRKSTSHGCVRHSNSDILKLYGMVKRGDVVYIVNHFRGKVLNRADFSHSTAGKNKHVAQDEVAPSAAPAQETPAEERRKAKEAVMSYYMVET